ncbi:Excinuclease ABC subunit C [Ekhidna lutea]|uniref:UvrABC system protein C n=1 Tax=Ekhidna lutea TaxID=447679 RepID=A0A239FCN9_EKHLU|nr:excinuclease ABC subunit UvrC [Ekhidna lutea]SNS53922.1 Excinuclease ABC subunit C [Ekhidna lutea]
MEFQRYSKDEYLKLPERPGIYKFFDQSGNIIYVGKAKSLKKRVASYFTKANLDNRKTYRLVSEIQEIEFVIVSSEFDALLLENNLIKENQPRYNILLKDDKSFPSICITNERFPRIYSTRRIDHTKGEYFGPYTSVKAMNGVIDLIRKIHKIRTCKYNLSKDNIKKKKFKVCLEYHIGNCLGPCEGLQTEDDYLKDIDEAKKILKGKIGIVSRSYKEKMTEASGNLKFELAQSYKEKYDLLEKFQSRSLIVNQKITSTDVFTTTNSDNKNSQFINYMRIENGAIINSETIEVKKKIEEDDAEVFRFSIFDLRKKYGSNNPTILTNVSIEPWEDIEVIVPKIGDKKKLVELSFKNALYYKKEKLSSKSTQPNEGILLSLQEDLKLSDLPKHIECFDNSNIQGTNPVASMVCFRNGKPYKSDYRKFNIKTVTGPDDFGSMKEVVGRRYAHLKKEGISFPNLIVIDGGKGQLNAACDALKELNIYGQVPIIGIAKRLEEIYFPDDNLPIHINKKSTSLKLIQQIRDEAHRFAITFHRQKRSKESIESSLDSIKGIGASTREKIMREFGSVARLKQSSEKDLIDLVGQSKAKIIQRAIKKGVL